MSRSPATPSFDPDAVPLVGTVFVEASAGTGKTFALTSLYLRLIFEQDLLPKEILVVTFTKAATGELRERIRSRLVESLAADRDGPRAKRARRALREFDEAAIFTIHGFCQRALQETAFESGRAFEAELVEEPFPIQRALVHDLMAALLADEDEAFREWLSAGAGRRWQFEPVALLRLVTDQLGADEKMPITPEPAQATPRADNDASDLCAAADDAWQRFAALFAGSWDEVEALLVDPGTALNRRSYKADSIRTKWREELSQVCSRVEEAASAAERAGIEPPDAIRKYLTVETIASHTTRNSVPPEHPLFHAASEVVRACDVVTRAFDARAVALRRRFVERVREASHVRRRDQHVLFFDDLLVELRAALEEPGGEVLATTLRKRHRVALIDEFQDTDPVQYDVFRRVWHGESAAAEGCGLFLIGDPKQAIYAFRGADVQTYLAAREDAAGEIRSLGVNHRSEPAVIDAVNAVFGASRRPFELDSISFAPVVPAERLDRPEYRAPERHAAGLRVSFLARADAAGEGDVEGSTQLRDARTRWMQTLARDVADLLDSGATLGDRRVAPSDIAILARRKSELDAARRALEAIGIPCVSRGEGNVFEAREAWELASLLDAWLHPGDPRRLRAALASGAHGCDATALAALGDDSAELAEIAERFAEYGRIWTGQGFGRAFTTWRNREAVSERLLGYADGDRRLTNWLHLAELLAAVESERGASRAGLRSWLDRAIADRETRAALGSDASLLRLERDDEAVQLVTLHGSKGLEYEIVYLPALWESFESRPVGGTSVDETKKRPPIRYSDPETRLRSLDLGADLTAYDRSRELARAEREAEHLRLLYVGLTRAKRHCVVFWGRIGKAYAKSPFARLVLDASPELEGIERKAFERWAKSLDDDAWLAALGEIARNADPGSIRIEASRFAAPARWQGAIARVAELEQEPLRPLALRPLATTSFSALIRAGQRSTFMAVGPLATGRDLDADAGTDGHPDIGLAAGPEAAAEREAGREAGAAAVGADAADAAELPDLAGEMHAFPRGAEAGTLLHEVLERADLSALDEAAIRALAREWLAKSPLRAEAVDSIVHVVQSVARTPLRREPKTLRLCDLPRDHILPELEFTLAAPGDPRGRGFLPEALARILAAAPEGSPARRYAERAASLSWPALTGYLRGFIDAVFFDGERWFVVDYKSNHLGNRQRDYLPDRLLAPMIEHDYVLQSLLYTVAVDRYLAGRVVDYDYDRDFGGAYYLFVRGMALAHPPGCGIFHDRPDAATVRAISALLGTGSGANGAAR